MSHCTKFNFQYTDKGLICKVFDKLGLSYKDTIVKTFENIKGSVDEYSMPFGTKRNAVMAKRNGFNYFMEDFGNHYELSIEKHNMTYSEEQTAKTMADEYRQGYIKLVAEQVVDNMLTQGSNAVLTQTDEGFLINFGATYEKSILIKFENGRVIEEVQGVKGKSCVSLTEALENMLSSSDVELQSEWTSEYYENPDNELTIYNMEID